jgi:DNA mismatch endonuclease, patch repair protein
MVDIVDSATRSRMMSGIQSKNTKPEIIVRKFLHSRGFRFRLHVGSLPGKPDIVLPKYRAIVFVHGCFWHRHEGCRLAYTPKTRTDFWVDKLRKNADRDSTAVLALLESGWRLATIWECSLRDAETRDGGLTEVCNWLISDWPRFEYPVSPLLAT